MAARAEVPLASPFEALLALDAAKDLLRFTTAGSVDDGKSTLIGRLLYDSRSVFEDQMRSVAKASAMRGDGSLDLSLLTDGLRAEREQGITIDVAYRYFSTARRKFIIADTPGHEQYTRNMATGASTADLAVILVDARHGVLAQSRRHASIARLLGIPKIVVAVNKMDAAGYSESVYRRIEEGFTRVLRQLGWEAAWFVPISALRGDNVVHASTLMPWFDGPSLLEYLETVEIGSTAVAAPFRMPVQYVIRPNQDFRGYAGQIAAGAIRPGDEILAVPSGRRTHVRTISTFDGDLHLAQAPMSVTLVLEENIDISRGDILAAPQRPPQIARSVEADLVWMSEQPLEPRKELLLKHTSRTVKARVAAIAHRLNIETLTPEPAGSLSLNAIGVVRIETAQPLYLDSYEANRSTGSFILIDPVSNATAGAGMIRRAIEPAGSHASAPVTPHERALRYGHCAAIVKTGNRREVARALERRLFDHGCAVTIVPPGASHSTVTALLDAGLLVLIEGRPEVLLPPAAEEAAEALFRHLERARVLTQADSLVGGEGI
jgi:sulfate adenylyltransferase large subunit